MFIQVVRGRVRDADAVLRQLDHWEAELASGAQGWLGTTAGVTDEGQCIGVVRFESEDAARANSMRPEQSGWFEEYQALFEGPVMFYDCPDVILLGNGGSNDAGFVQVMVYKTSDVQALKDVSHLFESVMHYRPDILGAATGFATDGSVIDTTYFTSEDEARVAEAQEWPPEIADAFEKLQAITSDMEYIDLRNPHFGSP